VPATLASQNRPRTTTFLTSCVLLCFITNHFEMASFSWIAVTGSDAFGQAIWMCQMKHPAARAKGFVHENEQFSGR
jgi:hypothetical protein